MPWKPARKSSMIAAPWYATDVRTHTSTRLHVERMTPSEICSRSSRPRRAHPIVSAGKASFSRISTGALRWFSPTMTMWAMDVSRSPSSTGEARIGVQPREQEVDAQEREQDGAEPHDGEDRRLPPPPTHGESAVEEGRVEEPRDEGPRLLGVPAPVRSPGVLGPDGAGDDPEREERESHGEALVVDVVQHVERRQALEERPEALPLDLLLLEEVHDPGRESHGEHGVADEQEDDVDGEPVRVEGGCELADFPLHEGGEDAEHEGQGGDEGAEDPQVVPHLDEEEDGRD